MTTKPYQKINTSECLFCGNKQYTVESPRPGLYQVVCDNCRSSGPEKTSGPEALKSFDNRYTYMLKLLPTQENVIETMKLLNIKKSVSGEDIAKFVYNYIIRTWLF